MTLGGDRLTRGAVFHRCALQVNPFEYARKYRGIRAPGDRESHARELIAKALEVGVSVFAITDHNNVSSVSVFREAADDRITIFPGFEVTSSEGIHVLCIYPPEIEEERLNRFLGELGIREPGPTTTLSDKPFVDLLATVRDQGGITIAAHVTSSPGGLLEVLSGQARIKAWRTPDLLAIQVPKPVDQLNQWVRAIIRNEDPQYRRTRTVGGGLAVAPVNARDVVSPSDLEDSAASCWIKMSRISIEGLRQAFLDPGSRIQLYSEETEVDQRPQAEMQEMAWEGGFLDGTKMPLNPNLNVLIGGRGAGKSTVVESLRYVLGLDPIGENAQRVHQGIVSNVLRSGTKISLLVRTHGPTTQSYWIERTVPNPPVVRDEDGAVSNLLPQDILPHVEIYGQHEIAELTRSGPRRTRLLDRFVEQDSSFARRKTGIQQDLETNRESVVEAQGEVERLSRRLEQLPGLEETLERYREAGLEERLRDRSLLVREEGVLDSIEGRLEALREYSERLRQELPLDLAFLSGEALDNLPGREILVGSNRVLEQLDCDLQELSDGFGNALARADEGITEIRSRWEDHRQEVQDAYEAILRSLKRSAVHGEEFIRLRGRIERLRPLRRQITQAKGSEAQFLGQRDTILAEWEDLKTEEFQQLAKAARSVTERLNGRVQVEVVAAGERKPLIKLLRDRIGGNLAKTIDILESIPDLSPLRLAATCRSGADAIVREYGTTQNQASRLAAASCETLMRIEEVDLPTNHRD